MSGLRWLFLATMLFAPATPANTPPEAPRPTARVWLLVDHDSGRVLTEHGADQPAGAGLAHQADDQLPGV